MDPLDYIAPAANAPNIYFAKLHVGDKQQKNSKPNHETNGF